MAAKGAPNKPGLDYFPKMVNFYEDDKVFDLLEKYGPLGATVYDVILTIVYASGYYVEMTEDKLSRMVIRKIGSKWVPNKKVVVQVIHFCADSGLLDAASLSQGVITSVGIQRRYYKIAVKLMKRQLYSKKYWILDENGEPLLNAHYIPFSSEENGINSEENGFNSEVSPQKEKEKENNIYLDRLSAFQMDARVEPALSDFINHRKSIKKPMTDRAVELLLTKLKKLSAKPEEQIRILNQSILNGWQDVYPLKKTWNDQGHRENRFHNFDQRDTDYNATALDDVLPWLKRGECGDE